MELRYLEMIEVEKAIVHVIDKSLPEPLYSQTEITTEEILEEFIPCHVTKVLNEFDNIKGKFVEYVDGSTGNQVNETIQAILDGSPDFAGDTAFLSKVFYKSVADLENIQAFDLLFAVVNGGGERMLAIMKLDYQMNYVHDVSYDEQGVKVEIISQYTGLPTSRQRLTNCAVILPPGRYDYDMMLLNKKEKDGEGNPVNFFMDTFLEAEPIYDGTSKTIAFRNTVEKWLRKTTKDDAPKAEDARNLMSTILTEHAVVDVSDLVYKISDDNEQKENLEEKLAVAGIGPGDQFEIDKKWVEKKLKQKQIKTDTGFVLKAEKEFFSDKARFETVYNGDGTVTYIIKNVRNVSER